MGALLPGGGAALSAESSPQLHPWPRPWPPKPAPLCGAAAGAQTAPLVGATGAACSSQAEGGRLACLAPCAALPCRMLARHALRRSIEAIAVGQLGPHYMGHPA